MNIINEFTKILRVTASIAFFSLIVYNESDGNNHTPKLLTGIAEINYTPQVGLSLEGNYRGDDYASRGIHDPLYARALVACDETGEKLADSAVNLLIKLFEK